jgi:hypothetical protein
LLSPEDVAKAVTYLTSKESGMMTGSVINSDPSGWGAYQASPPTPDAKLAL